MPAQKSAFAPSFQWRLLSSLLALMYAQVWAAPPASNALPTGGQITHGSGNISQAGANMLINQTSQRLATTWQTFNIGSNASVVFNQPSLGNFCGFGSGFRR